MIHLVLGLGEVGKATSKILSRRHEVWGVDIGHAVDPKGNRIEVQHVMERIAVDGGSVGIMHVALNAYAIGRDKFISVVQDYLRMFKPGIMDVLSTVWPGTTESFGPRAVHSTTRGLHPNLYEGIMAIPKHIGGPKAGVLAAEFSACGVKCVTHRKARTTEWAHLLHLVDYGVQIMSADMKAAACRHGNVDYLEAVTRYCDTHNSGFLAMDMPSKVRMNLLPSGGKIGGHCVMAAAKLALDSGFTNHIVSALAEYNGEPIKGGDQDPQQQPCWVYGCEDDHAEAA